MVDSANQKRVLLWGTMRSLSTAFMRSMMNRSNTKVIFEAFSHSYYFGPERTSKRYENEPPRDEFSYKKMKARLEEDYADYEVVFAKDMPYYLADWLKVETLPKRYVHTFIIREPYKTMVSLLKMATNKELTGWDYFEPKEAGYKEMLDMLKIVTEELGQEAIIIDADDLLQNPEQMLRLYCSKVGIDYQDRMLNWEPLEDIGVLEEWKSWILDALASTCFKPSNRKVINPKVLKELPDVVTNTINESMVYYEKLYAERLKLVQDQGQST